QPPVRYLGSWGEDPAGRRTKEKADIVRSLAVDTDSEPDFCQSLSCGGWGGPAECVSHRTKDGEGGPAHPHRCPPRKIFLPARHARLARSRLRGLGSQFP